MVAIILGFLVLALLGAPFFVLLGGGAVALFLERTEGAWESAGIDVFSNRFAESPFLMVIPMFTVLGFALAESGAPARLISLSRAWLGWLPGSLPAVCLVTSTFFATLTGASAATIVAVGGLTYPALKQERYPDRFAVGLISTAGSLGAMFPPSMLLIFYCLVTNLAIERAILAGILTGVISVLALMVYGGYVGARAGVARSPFVLRRALRELWISKWEVAIPFVLMGVVGSGWLRFQEASAMTVVYVLAIEVFVYRDLDLRADVPRLIVRAVTMLGAVMAILTTAVAFTSWLIQAEIPTQLFVFVEATISNRYVFLLALNAFFILIGMFTDGMAAIVVSVPMVLPLAAVYGIEPMHLAVIFLLNLELGFVIPPVGMNLFVSSIAFGKSIGYVCRSVVPFVAILLGVLALVSYVPWLSTFLPSLVDVPPPIDIQGLR